MKTYVSFTYTYFLKITRLRNSILLVKFALAATPPDNASVSPYIRSLFYF